MGIEETLGKLKDLVTEEDIVKTLGAPNEEKALFNEIIEGGQTRQATLVRRARRQGASPDQIREALGLRPLPTERRKYLPKRGK